MPCLCPLLDAPHGFLAVFAFSESREAEVAFAAGAEAHARCAHHVHFVEQLFEETPGLHALWSLQPDVGRVHAAIYREACGLQTFAHDAGVLHVIVDGGPHLCFPFGGIDGFRSALGDVARAIELGALAAVP